MSRNACNHIEYNVSFYMTRKQKYLKQTIICNLKSQSRSETHPCLLQSLPPLPQRSVSAAVSAVSCPCVGSLWVGVLAHVSMPVWRGTHSLSCPRRCPHLHLPPHHHLHLTLQNPHPLSFKVEDHKNTMSQMWRKDDFVCECVKVCVTCC